MNPIEDYPIIVKIVGDEIFISQDDLKLPPMKLRISELDTLALGQQLSWMILQVLKAEKKPKTNLKQKLPRLSVSEDYWTVKEYSELSNISQATVKRMCIRGELDAKKIASRWRISGKAEIK